jgi:hypothetical protein
MLVTIRVPDAVKGEVQGISVHMENETGTFTSWAEIVRVDREPVTHEEIRRLSRGKCWKCGKGPDVQHHCDEFRCEASLIEREIA